MLQRRPADWLTIRRLTSSLAMSTWLSGLRGARRWLPSRGERAPQALPASVPTLEGAITAVDQLRCHLDSARTADGRHLLLQGWAENVKSGILYWLDSSPGAKPVRLDPVIEPREDVLTHLVNIGRPVTTSRHGFLAALPCQGATISGARLCLVADGAAHWSPEFTVTVERVPLQVLLGSALAAARRSDHHLVPEFRRLAQPLVATPPPPPLVDEVRVVEPARDRPTALPRASIVVPFYGDDFYLLDHVMAQSRAPADVEWIFVCDDPRLSGALARALDERRDLVRQSTTLLILDRNGGFAHANNIGAVHARGTYLLLMNSDVYCQDFDFLGRAIALMEGDRNVGCVGFSMLFEDGTVQHDGMRFERVPWFGGLWASEHPGKGLPPLARPEAPTAVEAVTAALMLLRRADFASGRVFDPGYIAGDFEDGDLCLRLREQGRTVLLLHSTGLWHLERQSVRELGDGDARSAITLLNCLRFNARWAAVLDQSAASRVTQ